MNKTKEQIRIRKGGFKDELYLNRNGEWVRWKEAAVFTSQAAADKFAERHRITNYGLF